METTERSGIRRTPAGRGEDVPSQNSDLEHSFGFAGEERSHTRAAHSAELRSTSDATLTHEQQPTQIPHKLYRPRPRGPEAPRLL